ncbi:ubiquitin recognition factor in ER-associated degradation protein 1-like [Indicator indicator]|uniref:ubiquitin recognition factor in ER-associated degradation protein 1-like n=1 Tax=Indicator indicator TaxID=1002788 RepID=UPI0023DF4357|nr:ubiquitin recognition factor in ER-associated degradation protein 1-like [Indicator indicator]
MEVEMEEQDEMELEVAGEDMLEVDEYSEVGMELDEEGKETMQVDLWSSCRSRGPRSNGGCAPAGPGRRMRRVSPAQRQEEPQQHQVVAEEERPRRQRRRRRPARRQNQFSCQYRCFSVLRTAGTSNRPDVERGGKIILPPSALAQLSQLNTSSPMVFRLTNPNGNRSTHCGVLEFVAEEGICYLPPWVMQLLELEEGEVLQVENVQLQMCTQVTLQPQSPEFLDITDVRAVLEDDLRHWPCLTTGDLVPITYNAKVYELRVMGTRPAEAVIITDCDINVDIVPPLGYQEPRHEESPAFSGRGHRLLEGKGEEDAEPHPAPAATPRGIPNYDFKPGRITFLRDSQPPARRANREEEDGSQFIPFSGKGYALGRKE